MRAILAILGLIATLSLAHAQNLLLNAGQSPKVAAAATYTGLCDTSVSGASCAHYWGLRAATAALRGPTQYVATICDSATITVCTAVGTDATTGLISVATISALSQCNPGPCSIKNLVDQISGAGVIDFFANTAAIAPVWNSTAGPSAGFSAAVFVASSNQYLIALSGATINQPNISIATTYKHTSSAAVIQVAFGNGSGGGFFFPEYENPNLVELNTGTTALPVAATDNAYHTVLAVAGVGGVSGHGWISVDAGSPATSTTIGTDNLLITGARMGCYAAATFCTDMDFEELAIWASDVSANVSSISSNAHTFWGF